MATDPIANPPISLQDWIGRSETVADTLYSTPVRALSATLDINLPAPGPSESLPPLWHWLYFLPLHSQSEIGLDGHARRGGFLPPVNLPRRMWAGGQLQFQRALKVGEAVRRVSTIRDVTQKQGRTGPLVFVKVEHAIFGGADADPALVEFHDIVYRDAESASEHRPAPERAELTALWMREIQPDPVLLFRYSALTFNGHRIHYDRTYVTQEEGYPGLVVHGPLVATLLLELVRREQPLAVVEAFSFKAVRPLFDLHPFAVCGVPSADGHSIALWAQDHEGYVTMRATATLRATHP
jgi:3-methylfumaryl-CoA hydratase